VLSQVDTGYTVFNLHRVWVRGRVLYNKPSLSDRHAAAAAPPRPGGARSADEL